MIKLLYIDLFCGAGGTTTGVEAARIGGKKCAKVIACVNHDANAIRSHAANHPDALHFITEHFNEVLRYAVKKEESVPHSGQSRGFSKIIILEREIKGVGTAKLTVGVRPDGEMVHYCITAAQADFEGCNLATC